MATRDRTPSYILLKTEYKNRRPLNHKQSTSNYQTLDQENRNGLIPLVSLNNNGISDTQPNLQQLNVLPSWMQVINDIDINLSKIKSQIEKLKGYHDKNLLPDMNMEDQSDLERSIEILTSEITRLFHKTHNMIRNIGSGIGSIITVEDMKMKNNIKQSKSAKLQSLSILFRQIQKLYLNGLKKRSNLFSDIYNKGSVIDEEELNEEDEIIFDFSIEQKQLIDKMENEITTRAKEIKNIVKSVNDLSALFQDLSLLVAQQGTILDRIDYNLNETETMLIDSNRDIIIARRIQKEYTSRLCILMILVALVVAMVFIFILKLLI
ncbi:hypothetical protein ACTA71_004900 [Dictyostelium dimigraforme]